MTTMMMGYQTGGGSNPDRRQLPAGWSEHYDPEQRSWFYRQTNVYPSRTSFIHPLDQAQPPTRVGAGTPIDASSTSGMTRAQMLYASAFANKKPSSIPQPHPTQVQTPPNPRSLPQPNVTTITMPVPLLPNPIQVDIQAEQMNALGQAPSMPIPEHGIPNTSPTQAPTSTLPSDASAITPGDMAGSDSASGSNIPTLPMYSTVQVPTPPPESPTPTEFYSTTISGSRRRPSGARQPSFGMGQGSHDPTSLHRSQTQPNPSVRLSSSSPPPLPTFGSHLAHRSSYNGSSGHQKQSSTSSTLNSGPQPVREVTLVAKPPSTARTLEAQNSLNMPSLSQSPPPVPTKDTSYGQFNSVNISSPSPSTPSFSQTGSPVQQGSPGAGFTSPSSTTGAGSPTSAPSQPTGAPQGVYYVPVQVMNSPPAQTQHKHAPMDPELKKMGIAVGKFALKTVGKAVFKGLILPDLKQAFGGTFDGLSSVFSNINLNNVGLNASTLQTVLQGQGGTNDYQAVINALQQQQQQGQQQGQSVDYSQLISQLHHIQQVVAQAQQQQHTPSNTHPQQQPAFGSQIQHAQAIVQQQQAAFNTQLQHAQAIAQQQQHQMQAAALAAQQQAQATFNTQLQQAQAAAQQQATQMQGMMQAAAQQGAQDVQYLMQQAQAMTQQGAQQIQNLVPHAQQQQNSIPNLQSSLVSPLGSGQVYGLPHGAAAPYTGNNTQPLINTQTQQTQAPQSDAQKPHAEEHEHHDRTDQILDLLNHAFEFGSKVAEAVSDNNDNSSGNNNNGGVDLNLNFGGVGNGGNWQF